MIPDRAFKAVDGLVNVATSLGTNLTKRGNNRFQYDALNDYATYEAAYQSNFIARMICDVPAEDMVREWRTIKSVDAEEIEREEQRIELQRHSQDAISWARLFGGGGILMLTGQDLTKPLNINKIKKGDLQRLITFDRWEMQPLTMNTWNVLAPNYLEAEFYSIANGQTSIHYSHFAKFYGAKLPRRMLQYTQGWGDSELRKCLEDLMDLVASVNGIAELMQEANVDVIKREGLFDDLASDQDKPITDHYTLQRMMKGNTKMLLLDKDGEEYDRNTLSLSGVAPVIELFFTYLSGAARIPVTKLFGTSAKGMNATGEGDDKNYRSFIGSSQTSQLAPPLSYLDEIMVRSALGYMPDDYDYVWNPLSQPDQVELSQAELLRAQKDVLLKDAGIIKVSQIQRNLQSNEEYQFDDDDIEELEKAEAEDPFNEFGEGEENGVSNESGVAPTTSTGITRAPTGK